MTEHIHLNELICRLQCKKQNKTKSGRRTCSDSCMHVGPPLGYEATQHHKIIDMYIKRGRAYLNCCQSPEQMVLFQILLNQLNYTEGEVIIIKVLLWTTITYSVNSIFNVVMFAAPKLLLYTSTRGTCLSGKNR